MKKLVFILIPALLLAIFFFVSYQYLVKSRAQKGALQVTSVPESKVYLDSTFIGQTPLCKCDAGDMLKTGNYTIRLVPIEKDLPEFQEKIILSEGVLTVVDRKFGKDSLSEGFVISLTPLLDKQKRELLVASFPQGATIFLDDDKIGQTPVLYKDPTESDHVLKGTKNGYQDKSIRIRTPSGYKLTVAMYLSTSTETAQQAANPVASSSAAVSSPSPVSVIILDTPTGFLRVRASNALDSAEVGRVTPGATYELLEEQAGWFKIKLSDKEGWISDQYARKQ